MTAQSISYKKGAISLDKNDKVKPGSVERQ